MYFFSQNRNNFVYKKRIIKWKIRCQFLLVKLKNNVEWFKSSPTPGRISHKIYDFIYI